MSTLVSIYSVAGFWEPSIGQMLIILALILIFFGPSRLPQLSRSLGKAISDFKRGLHDVHEDIESTGTEQTPPVARAAGPEKKDAAAPASPANPAPPPVSAPPSGENKPAANP